MNEEAVEILKELLDRMEVCNKPDCLVCIGIKRQIGRLGDLLGMTEEAVERITPRRLRGL